MFFSHALSSGRMPSPEMCWYLVAQPPPIQALALGDQLFHTSKLWSVFLLAPRLYFTCTLYILFNTFTPVAAQLCIHVHCTHIGVKIQTYGLFLLNILKFRMPNYFSHNFHVSRFIAALSECVHYLSYIICNACQLYCSRFIKKIKST